MIYFGHDLDSAFPNSVKFQIYDCKKCNQRYWITDNLKIGYEFNALNKIYIWEFVKSFNRYEWVPSILTCDELLIKNVLE